MANIIKATVSIRGTRPLLFHRFGPDAIPLEKQEKSGVSGNDPQEWRKTALVTREGQLYLEPTYVFGSIRDGAKHTSRRRGTLQPYVAATLQILGNQVLVDQWFPNFPNGHTFDIKSVPAPSTDPNMPVYLYVCSVKNPATKGRNVRYRIAASVGWKSNFTILWDATVVSRGEMQASTIDAGRLVGIGDGRSVGFGRFEVESFVVTED